MPAGRSGSPGRSGLPDLRPGPHGSYDDSGFCPGCDVPFAACHGRVPWPSVASAGGGPTASSQRPSKEGRLMRKLTLIVVTAVLAVVGGLLVSGGVSQAAQGADLAVTGSVAGGEASTESSHLIVFVFTLTNKGPAATDGSADLTLTDVQGGTVVDTMCVLPNGFGIN